MKRYIGLCVLLFALGCTPHRSEVKITAGATDSTSYEAGVSVRFLPGLATPPGPQQVPGAGFGAEDPYIHRDLFVMLESACREIDAMDRMMAESSTGPEALRRLEATMGMKKDEIDQTRKHICEETPRSMTIDYLRIELRMLDQIMAAYAGALDQPQPGNSQTRELPAH